MLVMVKYWNIAQCTASIWNIVHIPKKSVVDLYAADVGNPPRSLFREKKKLHNYHIYVKKLLRSRYVSVCITFYRFFMYCTYEIYVK